MLSRAPFAQGALCLAVCIGGAWSEVAAAESKASPSSPAEAKAGESDAAPVAVATPAPERAAIEPGRGAGQRRVSDDAATATPAKSEPGKAEPDAKAIAP